MVLIITTIEGKASWQQQWDTLLCSENICTCVVGAPRVISATPSQIKRYLSPSIKSQLMCNPSMFSHRMGLLDSDNTRFFFRPNINSIFMRVILFQPKLRTLRDWRCLVCSMQKEVIWLYSRFNAVSFRNDFVKYAKTPFIWFIVRDIEIKVWARWSTFGETDSLLIWRSIYPNFEHLSKYVSLICVILLYFRSNLTNVFCIYWRNGGCIKFPRFRCKYFKEPRPLNASASTDRRPHCSTRTPWKNTQKNTDQALNLVVNYVWACYVVERCFHSDIKCKWRKPLLFQFYMDG